MPCYPAALGAGGDRAAHPPSVERNHTARPTTEGSEAERSECLPREWSHEGGRTPPQNLKWTTMGFQGFQGTTPSEAYTSERYSTQD